MSLRDMKEIRLGQTTDVFRKDPRPDLVQSSFSLIFPDRRSPSPQSSFRTEFTLLNFLISPLSIDLVAPNPSERNTWVFGLQQVHEMLAGSHAGQQLNYLLAASARDPHAAEPVPAASASDVSGGGRNRSMSIAGPPPVAHDGHVTSGLSSQKSLAAMQADSHMKHVDVYVDPLTAHQIPLNFTAPNPF